MNRLRLGLALLGMLALAGCDTGSHQRLNCICLIDYSGSLSEATLHRYVEIISSGILGRLREKDRLVVIPIDEGAKTEAVKLVYLDLAQRQFTFHTDGYAHAKDSLDMRLREFSGKEGPQVASQLLREKELRQKYTYFTDIFSALEQAAGLVERNQPDSFWDGVRRFISGKKRIVSTNVILIFSDMIQETSEVSFANPEGCTSDQARAILDKLQAWNRIPDLHGCVVFVTGRTGTSNQQVDNIQNFWTQYFKRSGAQLVAYDYDTGPQVTSFLEQRALAGQ